MYLSTFDPDRSYSARLVVISSSASSMSFKADWESRAKMSLFKCNGLCTWLWMKLMQCSDLSHAFKQVQASDVP